MKKLQYISLAFLAVFSRVAFPLEAPATSNPIGLGTVPPTAYRSGLVPSINPLSTGGGNMIVTGNVAGEAYFRGVVPYRGVTDFGTATTSLSTSQSGFTTGIDSFLRRTSGSQIYQQPGGVTPYYSQNWTVTKTIPGSGGMVTTPTPSISSGQSVSGAWTETPTSADMLRSQMGYYRMGYLPQMSDRPLSMSQQELEQLINTDITQYTLGGEPVSQVEAQTKFWKQLGVKLERRMDMSQGSNAAVAQQWPATSAEPNVGMLLAAPAVAPGYGVGRQNQQMGQEPAQQSGGLLAGIRVQDVFEQMKIRLSKPVKATEDINALIKGFGPGQAPSTESPAPTEPNRTPGATKRGALERSMTGASTVAPASPEEIYKSFAAFSDDKFNQHMKTAENYMKQGRFYRAADAYTLATIYKPDDPLGYAGKSIALFGSGEYMSSSLFLARTLEIFPEYAKLKIDLVGMIGDKDTVENSILEVRDWLKKSNSAELSFLLSYVYYQMDRLEFARKSIEDVAKTMPDSKAVKAMKMAIDERIANQSNEVK